MTTTESRITDTITTFVANATRDAEKAFRVFRETGTVSANGTVNFVERVPGEEIAVALNEPGPWGDDPTQQPGGAPLDREGRARRGGGGRGGRARVGGGGGGG
ncbi:hypothetical protein ACFWPB_04405, partial [Rhodococcus sp. NPDC058514]